MHAEQPASSIGIAGCTQIPRLEIWSKAQRASTQSCKSDWGNNLESWNSPLSKVTWLELVCLSKHRTHIVDLRWVNVHA